MAANRAYTKKSRTNRGSAIDAASSDSYQTNPYSGGKKIVDVGPEFLKDVANAFVSGRDVSGSSNAILPGSIIYLYNNAATVAWVALSTAAIGADPTGFADGIPLKPNDWTILSAGENSFIRSSANTVGLYEMKDDTALIDQTA